MFCYKCGTEIPDESEFCLKCGTKMPNNGSEAIEQTEANVENESKKKKQTFMQKLMYGESGATSFAEFNEKIKSGEYVVPQKSTPTLKTEKSPSKRQRIKENKKSGIACCPKCGSTSISANKKGFGIGKAVIGAGLIGNPIGLVGGNLGAKKVRVTCLNCGHQWYAGKK